MKIAKPDQNRMLAYFSIGSMIVLLVCLSIASGFVAYSFLQKEKQRASISKDQIEHFFEFHHTSMSEEMWTGSLDPIARRVALIANQIGGAKFSLVISDENGKCLMSQKQANKVASCDLPSEMQTLIRERTSRYHPTAVIRFDDLTQSYVYMAPLAVGETVRGYLHVTLTDPYDFYRGSVVSVTSSTFLPILAVILFIWILWLFASREFFLNPYLRYVNEMKADERFADQARRTAHDLRDPISGLERCLKRISNHVPPGEQKHMLSFLYQMEDVANSLLSQSRLASQNTENVDPLMPSPVHLLPVIERVVSRKKLQYGTKQLIAIKHLRGLYDWKRFANIVEMDFERLLSNLINNAVEAIEREGSVGIEIFEEAKSLVIKIMDNGGGIPKGIVPQIGQKGFTYGKRNGNGLGLYYAKALLESWGGNLTIDSIEGKGTTVCLHVPKADSPKWFPHEITIANGTKVVVLDDQLHAHDLWEERFKSIEIPVKHYSKASDFLKDAPFEEPVLYLLDYDLKGERHTGIDIIDELELYDNAVLVTSQPDESIQALCERMGVRLLPKNVAEFIPLIYKEAFSLQSASGTINHLRSYDIQ